MTQPERLSGLRDIADGLHMVICDVWGVLHDGEKPFAGAFGALREMRARGIPVILLTNSPRPAARVHEQTLAIWRQRAVWDHVVSSGELAIRHLNDHFSNRTFYHMGLPRDRDTVRRIRAREVRDIAGGDVIVCTGFEAGRINDLAAHRPLLERALARRAQFICVNPDRYVDVGHRRYMCAGLLAETYEDMGGAVHWMGKPFENAYAGCLAHLPPQARPGPGGVLCIGDSLKTDIAGASGQGMRSLFIEHGLHREETGKIDWLNRDEARPDYVIPSLKW